jgi:DNA-binding response OmpR family regulator
VGERFPDVPVLYISGYPGDEIQQRGLLGPGATFLQKPFSPDELVRRVREVLATRRPVPRS